MSFMGTSVHTEKHNLRRLKPGVNRAVHLFAAPLLWTVVGSMLVIRGAGWIDTGYAWGCFILALIVGTAKSVFILDKTARRGVDRIVDLQDGTCLGAVYSWKSWILVVLMMTSGILFRVFFVPGSILGTVYVAIGWALILSSRHGWFAWLKWIKRKG